MHKSGGFSTRSVYDLMTSGDTGHPFSHIWKARIPHRIKIFMWLYENKAILTKENLLRRNWQGDPSCYFCPNDENMNHLFFTCPIAKVIWGIIAITLGANNIPENLDQYKIWIEHWLPGGRPVYTFCVAAVCWAIWKRRNAVCFEKKSLRNPAEILLYACALMTYWAGLYGADMQGRIVEGVKVLIACAHKVLAQQNRPSPVLLLEGPEKPQESEEEASDNGA